MSSFRVLIANYFYLCRPANQSAACAGIGSMAAATTDWSDVARPRAHLYHRHSALTRHDQFIELVRFSADCAFFCLDWSLPYLLLLYICYGMRSSTQAVFAGEGKPTCWSAWSHAGMRLCRRHAWLRYNRLLWSCWSWWISKWLWWSSRSRIIAIRLYYGSTAAKWSASIATAATVNIAIGLIGNWCVSPVILSRRKALRKI